MKPFRESNESLLFAGHMTAAACGCLPLGNTVSNAPQGGESNDLIYCFNPEGPGTDVGVCELYNVGSPIYENAREGWDTVRIYVWSTTLWDNVEDLALIDPSSNTDGIGNTLGNIIRGNAGSNHLYRVDGNDIRDRQRWQRPGGRWQRLGHDERWGQQRHADRRRRDRLPGCREEPFGAIAVRWRYHGIAADGRSCRPIDVGRTFVTPV
jgi:hypothetical protein